MEHFVFLFNADSPAIKGRYGYVCNKSFVTGLSGLTFTQIDTISIQSGDLLLDNISRQLDTSEYSGGVISSRFKFDKYLYTSLLINLSDTLSETWFTYNKAELNGVGMNLGNIYCITVFNINRNMASSLNKTLEKEKFYLGAAQIDPGNPLHQFLFSKSLIPQAFIRNKQVFIEENREAFDWEVYFKPFNITTLDSFDFPDEFPRIPIPQVLSESGRKTSEIFKRKGKFSHHNKVARAYQKALWDKKIQRDTLLLTGNNEDEILIPKEKLVNYALNLQHEHGWSKAKFFKEVLNIETEDWRYLSEQIKIGLADGDVQNIRVDEHGIKYYVDIFVTGLNNIIRTVRTAWIIRPSQPMQLTTIHPAKEMTYNKESLSERPILALPKNLHGDEKWSELFRLGNEMGLKAGNQHIPTPIFFSGFSEPHMEGKLGWASIIFIDPKHEFVNWLKKNNNGYFNKKNYILTISHETQSAERAFAYANAFSKVLRANGVETANQMHLD